MENVIDFPDRSVLIDEATAWIIKISGDEAPSAEEIQALNDWVAQSPSHKAVFQELASTWDGLDLLSELVVPGPQALAQKRSGFTLLVWWLLLPLYFLLSLIGRVGRALTSPQHSRWVYGGAVSAGLVVTLWLVALQTPQSLVTGLGEQTRFDLEDGSTLWLNTNSHIVFDFSEQRRKLVLLKGEAHFEVKSDPSRPFEVHADARVVRAVGTAFSVHLLGDAVDVTVEEGEVDLSLLLASAEESDGQRPPASGPAPMTSRHIGSLLAGQGLAIPKDAEANKAALVHYDAQTLARRLAWKQGRLVFAGESLEAVVKEVSRYTDIRIECVGEDVKQLSIGGNFPVGQIDTLLEALELGFDIEVLRVNDKHVQLLAKQ